MKVERLEDGSYNGTLVQILGLGKLKTKVVVISGETDREMTKLIGD